MDLLRDLGLCAMVFVPLEYVFALTPATLFSRERRLNLLWGLFNTAITAVPLTLLVFAVVTTLGLLVPPGFKEVVGCQPFWAQLVGAAILGDLGVYLGHRLMHHRLFWRFHAVHHGAEDMDWLVAFRFHPVDLAVMGVCSSAPLIVLGFQAEAIALYKWLYMWHAFFGHANLRWTLGPLRRVVVGPEFHHWHHARDRRAAGQNFSGSLVIWDRLFGTYHAPDGERPQAFGIGPRNPGSFLRQLAAPFRATSFRTTVPSGRAIPPASP